MTTEKEKSLSDSLLNNSSIQHGYGSLGIFHTPPLPGADHTATHIDSPVSINDDFLLNSHGSISPHFNEFASSHFTFKNTKRREQSLTISAPYAITPQHSGIASSTYSESPLSHTDYVKHTTTNNNKYLNTNQLYQYQHPYFNNINNNYPIYNEIFDTIPTPNNINYLYSNTLNKMSSVDDNTNTNIAGNISNNNENNKSNNSLFISSIHTCTNNNTTSGFQLNTKTLSKCQHLLPIIYIINAAVGLAFFSQPYAIAHGGWTSIIGFIIVVLISYHCCDIYIECLRRHTEYFHYPSYPQLGWIISGSWTYYSILIFSVCECVGIASVYIIFLWNNIYYLLCRFQIYGLNGFELYKYYFVNVSNYNKGRIWSLSNISEKNEMLVVILSIITIIPSILILKISSMYWLSYLILIGIIIMAFTLMFFIILHIITHEPLAHYDLEHPIQQNGTHGFSYIYTNFGSFSISIGIFLFCFTSNSYSKLPSIQQIQNKQQIQNILRKSYLLLFIMYVFIGICGYLLYGKSCHSIILRNIMHHCKHGIFCDLVCIFFIICTFSAISPLCIKISDFIESNVIYEWLRNKKNQQKTSINNNNNNNGFHLIMQPHIRTNTNTHTQSIDSIDSINSITNDSINNQQIIIPNITINNKHTISFDTSLSNNINKNNAIYITNNTKRICRITVFMLLLLISWMFRDEITFLESIVGIGFTTITCMILPCYLYLRSFWNTLSCLNKFAHILLTVFVIIATVALFIGIIIDIISGKDVGK